MRMNHGYIRANAATTAGGFDSPSKGAISRATFSRRGFFVRMASPMGGPCGEPQGSPVPLPGLSTRTVPPTRLTAGKRKTQPLQRRNAMSQAKTAAIDAALTKVIAAVDVTSLAKSCFYDLSGVFEAIEKLSDEHTTVHALAGIGKYLADDWGNLNDCEREALEGELASLRAIKTEGATA